MGMLDWLGSLHPVTQALLATLFTWGLTALGASPVLFTARFNRKIMDGMLGLASGVMIAASYWSLLAPAIEMSGGAWHPALLGFLAGGMFLYGVDKVLPHLHAGLKLEDAEGIKTSWQRSVLLVSAITLHNIPEGLAISLVLVPRGVSAWYAAWWSVFSSLPQPLMAPPAYLFVETFREHLPTGFGFAAGAMIWMVFSELIPDALKQSSHGIVATTVTLTSLAMVVFQTLIRT